MKIYGNDDILKSLPPAGGHRQAKPPAGDFSTVLKETLATAPKTNAALQQPLSVNSVAAARRPEISMAKPSIIAGVENLLNLLDAYRQKLAEPGQTLKQIQPVLAEILRQKQSLMPALETLAGGDGLKDIVNQALVTASLEEIRFNRGDYT